MQSSERALINMRPFPLPTFALSHLLAFAMSGCCTMGLLLTGCDTPPGSGGNTGGNASSGAGKSIFAPSTSGKERWSIRALHTSAPGHEVSAQRLADELKRTPGVQPGKVRVVTDTTGSTIYYGEYVKVAASNNSSRLVFPPEYQRDIEGIRRLIINQTTPFFYAEPEMIDKPAPSARSEFDVANARGAYTLYVAVFYNTPGFDQRREAAEQYVKLLRDAGISAYYRHEEVRSYVFVGDFDYSDVIAERTGEIHYGPRVQAFINQRPQEFQHLTENGHVVRYSSGSGQMVPPQSYLVPVPREGGNAAPGAVQPAQPQQPGPSPFRP